MLSTLPVYMKAILTGVSTAAAYLAGVVPAEGGFGDMTIAQWLAMIPIVLASGGIVAYIPNKQRTQLPQ